MKRTITVTKIRPAHWPRPEEIPGEYQTPFGVLVITEKFTSTTRPGSAR